MAKNQFGGNRPGGGSRPPFGGGGGGNRNNRRDSRYPSEDDKGQFRLNDQIRVPQIRLVGDNMEQISELVGTEIKSGEVYNTRDALLWAEKSELDLVEISPNAVPPVVRIIDYNKFLYEKKKKEKEIKAKAAKTVIKEIRFGPNTDDHDFEFKVRHAKTFLEENAKVKAYVNFRGRTIVFKDGRAARRAAFRGPACRCPSAPWRR